MKIKIFGLLAFCLLTIAGQAQEAHFSMFYNAPMQMNPALTGTHECALRIGTSYRDQWRSVSNPYKTFALFADANITSEKIKSNAFGLGMQFLGDQSGKGNLSTNDIRLFLAYHKSLMENNKLTVSLGLSLAMVNHAIHPDQLSFESQWTGNGFDQALPNLENFVKTSVYYYDMAAGLSLSYAPMPVLNIGLGGSLSHLTQPRYDFFGGDNKLGRKTCLHANINAVLSKKILLSSKCYGSFQDHVQEWIAGANLSVNTDKTPILLGLWYRFGRDIIPLAGVNIRGFQLMMSYDVNVSRYKIATQSMGGFEISLIKNLLCNLHKSNKSNRKKGNYNNCPKF